MLFSIETQFQDKCQIFFFLEKLETYHGSKFARVNWKRPNGKPFSENQSNFSNIMLEDRRHTQSREGGHQRAALIYCNGESFSGLCKNRNVLKLNKLFFRWFRAHIQEVQNHTCLSLFSFCDGALCLSYIFDPHYENGFF